MKHHGVFAWLFVTVSWLATVLTRSIEQALLDMSDPPPALVRFICSLMIIAGALGIIAFAMENLKDEK